MLWADQIILTTLVELHRRRPPFVPNYFQILVIVSDKKNFNVFRVKVQEKLTTPILTTLVEVYPRTIW